MKWSHVWQQMHTDRHVRNDLWKQICHLFHVFHHHGQQAKRLTEVLIHLVSGLSQPDLSSSCNPHGRPVASYLTALASKVSQKSVRCLYLPQQPDIKTNSHAMKTIINKARINSALRSSSWDVTWSVPTGYLYGKKKEATDSATVFPWQDTECTQDIFKLTQGRPSQLH